MKTLPKTIVLEASSAHDLQESINFKEKLGYKCITPMQVIKKSKGSLIWDPEMVYYITMQK